MIVIDFGTSNTVVCTTDTITQQPRTLKFDSLSRRFNEVSVIPSQVFVKSPDNLIFGEPVRSQRLGFSQPQRYFQAFKRDLAADFVTPPRVLDNVNYTAEAISEQFLKEIWNQVNEQLEPSRVVFTVPVGAFERYLHWFNGLGEKLGIPELQIVDESTAAALG
ncbi:MAG: Hsp70 family protein, partial [Cyanobacteria bacterium J06621_15]